VRSYDDCPSAKGCAGNNLHPVLKQVYDLYASGVTDKYDILDALDDASEDLLVRFNKLISPVCWSKAALLTIAEVIQERIAEGETGDDLEQDLRAAIARARDAFERFPWHLSELVEQAPDLHQAILEAYPEANFAGRVSKR